MHLRMVDQTTLLITVFDGRDWRFEANIPDLQERQSNNINLFNLR